MEAKRDSSISKSQNFNKSMENKEFYQNSVPDYLRISEFFLNKKNIQHPDRINVLDKFNGWLTVDSKTLKRGDAWEKKTDDFNLRKTSATSPEWMQNSKKIERDG